MRRIPLLADPTLGYAFALLTALLLFGTRLSLQETGLVEGDEAPFVALFTIVLATAILGGFGPATLAVLLSGSLTALFYFEEFEARDAFRVLLFTLDIGLSLFLVHRLAGALRESRQALDAERSAVDAASRADARNAELLDATRAVAWEANDPGFPYAIDFVSRGITDLLGYSMEEVLDDKFWTSIIHEDDWRQVTSDEQRYMKGNDTYVVEYRARHKEGHIVWVRDTVRVERYADGGVMRLRGLMVDVTELKTALIEAQRRQAWLETVLAGVPSLIWEAERQPDGSASVQVLSGDAETITGYPRERFDDPAFWPSILEGGAASAVADRVTPPPPGEIRTREGRLLAADGSTRWLESRARGLYDEQGSLLGIMGADIDVTERKEAEAERNLLAAQVEQERDRLRETLDDVQGIAWQLDARTLEPTFVSAGIERILGYRVEEVQGNGWDHVIHPEDLLPVRTMEKQLASIGGELVTEYRVITKDGRTLWLRDHARSVHDATGAVVAVRGLMVDITELKRLADQREAERRRIVALVANIPGVVWEEERQPDGSMKTVFVSEGVRNVTGYPAERYEDENFWVSTVHEDDREEVLVEDGAPPAARARARSLRIIAADGSVRWLETRSRSILAPSGEVTGVVGIDLDVTAHRQAEQRRDELAEELRKAAQAERRAREEADALIDAIPGIVLVENRAPFSGGVGPTVRGSYVERLLGYSAAEINRDRRWSTLVHPDDAERRTREVRAAYESGTPINAARFVTRDGSFRWLTTRMQVLPERDGIKGFVEVLVDVTPEREAERELEELVARTERERAFLDGLLRDMEGAVREVDLGDPPRMTYISPSVERLLGYTARECEERGSLADFLHPDDRDRHALLDRVASGEDEFSLEYRMRHRDGRDLWIRELARVQRDADGRPSSVRGLLVDVTGEKEAAAERERLAREVDRQRAFLQSLLADMNGIAFEMAIDGDESKLTYVSPGVERVLGRTVDECLSGGCLPGESYPGEQTRAEKVAEVAADGLDEYHMEYRFSRKDGGFAWLAESGRLIRDESGALRAVRGLLVDISNLKTASSERDESLQRLETVVANIPGLVWEDRHTGGFQSRLISGQPEAIVGYPRECFDDPDFWLSIVHPDDRERARALALDPPAPGETRAYEERLRAADGTWRWVASRSRSITDAEGRITVIGVDVDVTEQKRAMEEREQIAAQAERDRDYLEALLSDLNGAIWEQAPDLDHLVFISPSIQRMLGYTPEECYEVGSWFNTVHPDDLPRARELVDAIAAGTNEYTFEYRQQHKDGHYVWVRDNARVFRDAAGEVTSIRGITSDISDRKMAEGEREMIARRLQTIVESVPGVIWEAHGLPGEAGYVDYVSGQVVELLGYEPAAWHETPNFWIEILHPDERETVAARLASASESPSAVTTEFRVRRADGHYLWTETRMRALRDDDGQPVGLVGFTSDISDRKRADSAILAANDALHEERGRLSSILANVPAMVRESRGEPGVDEHTIFVSDYARTMLGREPDDWLRNRGYWLTIVHPDDRDLALEGAVEAFRQGRPNSGEYRCLRADGTVIWIEKRHAPVSRGGVVVGLLSVSIDITERKLAETRLQKATAEADHERARLRALVDSVPGVVWESRGEDSPFDFVSPYSEVLFGYTPEQLSQPGFWNEVQHPEDIAHGRALFEGALEAGVPARRELRVRTSDGRWVWVEAFARPVAAPGGETAGVVGVTVDITDRKHAEQRVLEERNRYRALIESLPGSVWEARGEPGAFEVTFLSDGDGLLGYTPDEWRADPSLWSRIVHPEDRARNRDITREALESGGVVVDEVRVRTKDGQDAWIESRVNPIYGEDGQPRALVGFAANITERKLAELERERLLRELDDEQRKLTAVLTSVPVLIQADEIEGETYRITTLSVGSFADLLGYSYEELLDPQVWRDRIIHPDDFERVEEVRRNAEKDEWSIIERVRWLTATGDVRWVELRVSPVFAPDGRITGHRSIAVDTTERVAWDREREEIIASLRLERRRTTDLLLSLPVMVGSAAVEDGVVRLTEIHPGRLGDALGKRRDEIDSLPKVFEIIHPDDRDAIEKAIERVAREGRPFRGECRMLAPQGAQRQTEVWLNPMEGPDGSIAGFSGVAIDITERKRAEAEREDLLSRLQETVHELEAERQRFADLVENVPGMVFEAEDRADGTRSTRYVSGFAQRLLGYSEEQLHDTQFWRDNITHPEDGQRILAEIARAAAERRPGVSRVRWKTADGHEIWVDSRYRPVIEDGRVVGFRGVAVDVTEQVRGEEERERLLEELTRAHDQVETLLGSLPALVFETRGNPRDDGHFVFMAGGVERITGYSLAQHSDIRFWLNHIIHPDDRDRDVEQSADVMETGLPGILRERWVTSRGRTIWVETRMRPVFDNGGSTIGLRGVSIEITDQVRAEEALRESNEQKDEFLGLVSHELRTPITAIYGGARFLRTREASEEDRQLLLEDIERESERMHRLVENLLTLARAELGRGPEMEPVLTNRVTEQTVRAYLHRRPGREVRLELEEGLPPVMATQSYIGQIVRNLVSNADKYSPPSAPIVVRTFAPDERNVAIQVLDEGPGLGDTEPERLFERFYRSRETQNVASGLGLGLTVCKRLAEAMGGTITAHKRPERGLEFRVTLPIPEEEA